MIFQFLPLLCLALVLLVSQTPVQCNGEETGPNHGKRAKMSEASTFGSDLTEQNYHDFPYSQHDSFVNKREEDVTTTVSLTDANGYNLNDLNQTVTADSFPDRDVLLEKREQGSKQNMLHTSRKHSSFFTNREPGFGHTFAEKRDPGFAPSFLGKRAPRVDDTAVGKRFTKKFQEWLFLTSLFSDIDEPRTTTISEENKDVARPGVETYPMRDSIFQKKRATQFERRSKGKRSILKRSNIFGGEDQNYRLRHLQYGQLPSLPKTSFEQDYAFESIELALKQVCQKNAQGTYHAMDAASKYRLCEDFWSNLDRLCEKHVFNG